MSGEAKRRFLALGVKEVSIVGEPANEQEWLVTKQMETTMADETERVVVKDNNASTDNTVEVLKQVNGIVDTLCKFHSANSTNSSAVADVEKGTETTLKSIFKKAGLNDEQMEKAAKVAKEAGLDIDKAMPPALAAALEGKGKGKGEKPAEKPTKAKDDEEETTKAKAMTDGRIKKLEAIKAGVDGLLADIAPGGAVPPNLPDGKSPSASEITSTTKSQTAPTFDAAALGGLLTEAVTKAMAPVNERMDKMAAELADVKKARPSSNSVEGDGGTDALVAKGKKGLWSGLLS